MNFDLEIFIVDHYLVKNFKNITKNNTISCSNVYFFNGKFKIAEKYLKFAIRLSKIKNWAIKKLEFFVLGCSTGCLSCNGPSQEQCLDFNCKPYNWKEITPKGSYCRSCYSLCYSCFGSQSNNCLECRSDFSLIDNTCVKTTAGKIIF